MSWDLATTEALGLGVVLAAVAVLIVRLRRRRSDWRAEAEVALADCVSLIDLLKALQQHRGLSTGWLAGDRQFETRMQARRRNIDAMMSVVVRAAEHESGQLRPCFRVQEANLFRHRWRELIDRLPNSTPEQNIAAHTQQIEVLTGMIASLGEARLELPAVGSLPTGVIRNFCLPPAGACRMPGAGARPWKRRSRRRAMFACGTCAPDVPGQPCGTSVTPGRRRRTRVRLSAHCLSSGRQAGADLAYGDSRGPPHDHRRRHLLRHCDRCH